MDNKKLLLPKTIGGIASVLYFCLVWWILNNKPVMELFDNMAKEGNVTWLLGMPVNFVYIIAVALFTTVWTIILLAKWETGDDNE